MGLELYGMSKVLSRIDDIVEKCSVRTPAVQPQPSSRFTDVLDDLRKLKKDNTGYDVKNLFVGAEGTLGVITAAVMKVVPKPKGREVGWVGCRTPREALTRAHAKDRDVLLSAIRDNPVGAA